MVTIEPPTTEIIRCWKNIWQKMAAKSNKSFQEWPTITLTDIDCNIDLTSNIWKYEKLTTILGLNPLNQIITKSGYEYKFKSETVFIRYFHYMYSFIHLTRIYNDKTRMSFRPEKCGWMVINRGKIVMTIWAELPLGHISDLQASYFSIPYPTVTW